MAKSRSLSTFVSAHSLLNSSRSSVRPRVGTAASLSASISASPDVQQCLPSSSPTEQHNSKSFSKCITGQQSECTIAAAKPCCALVG